MLLRVYGARLTSRIKHLQILRYIHKNLLKILYAQALFDMVRWSTTMAAGGISPQQYSDGQRLVPAAICARASRYWSTTGLATFTG